MNNLRHILTEADNHTTCMVLISNSQSNQDSKHKMFDMMVAYGEESSFTAKNDSNFFNDLKKFIDTNKDWCFGHFSYDLKNQIEKLHSNNIDEVNYNDGFFFVPANLYLYKSGEETCVKKSNATNAKIDPTQPSSQRINKEIKKRISAKQYIETVNKIKKHIQRGDIFEINFCYEYFIENTKIDPVSVFITINELSPMPFAGFYKHNNKYLLCFSPERFLKKTGNVIISQPIKGTIKRGSNKQNDEIQKNELQNNVKERSENIMITDLVRNDLSKIAQNQTVEVEELCGIYGFKNIFQMISTIKAKAVPDIHPVDIIKNAFPMGSMTGAPKVRAMELIEGYETTKRGIYSGSIGYFTPWNDFDFNVVIRSIAYHSEKNFLNFMVGSAITANAVAEKELEECELKAKTLYDWIHSEQEINTNQQFFLILLHKMI